MEIFGYAASLIMGLILGLVGGGGSILTVPIMVYLFSLAPTVATGHSLFVVGITALVGSLIYMKKGDVDFKVGWFFVTPSLVGVTLSRALFIPQIPPIIISLNGFNLTKELLIMITFALLMIVASTSMIRTRQERKILEASSSRRMTLIAFQGLMVGLVAGFVGAGGGFLIIPALVLLSGLPMRKAIGTSLMIIAIQSLFGFAGDILRGTAVDWSLLITVASLALVGIILGSTVAHKIKEKKLKTAFGWFVLIMGSAILIEQIQRLSLK